MTRPEPKHPFHGVPWAGPAPASLVDQCLAYALRMPPSEFFSHLTAAELWGVPLPFRHEWRAGMPLHVSTRERRAPKAAGVTGHQLFDPAVGVRIRRGLHVTDPASTFCHLASILSEEDLVAAGDHLVLSPVYPKGGDPRPHVGLDELRARAAAFRGRGSVTARRAARLVRCGAESRRETLLRLRMLSAGLPEPELAVPIVDGNGCEIARVDMFYRQWRVAVEYDGEQHRTSTAQYDRDETRLSDLHHAAVRVVRIRKRTMDAGDDLRLIARALREAGASV